MFSYLRRRITRAIAHAASQGNPLARRLVAREMRGVLQTLPAHSPIVRGDFMTPDLSRPLPEELSNSLVGEYEMMPLERRPALPEEVVGRRIDMLSVTLGSYGMGGYGFFGLLLDSGEWLIVALDGAATWIELDGRILEDPFHEGQGAKGPWIVAADDAAALARISGARIVSLDIKAKSLDMLLDNGARFCISDNPDRRPILAGSRKKRAFLQGDDLRDAVFLSPSGEIFV
ncbi:hypothetical protein [Tropicibacter oceani]|uniref:Uncharacterized protein n=1 Tax=Tropicibacter oceani TaxID=3058420 RepID=A0ABY8QMR2_9RHOB|nr:hypothetical protein [Tropicibacter oceani]WGW05223.1 hypothetical protein QF118_06675 [Tropicibacter oceani]